MCGRGRKLKVIRETSTNNSRNDEHDGRALNRNNENQEKPERRRREKEKIYSTFYRIFIFSFANVTNVLSAICSLSRCAGK